MRKGNKMSRRLISLLVCEALILFVCSTSVTAGSREDKAARNAQKVKVAVGKLGTGPSARVEVKLQDKTKLKGYIDQIADDHFVVISDNTGAATAIPYPQVKQVKGNNLSTGAKIAIGVGVVALLVLFAFAVGDRR